MSKFAVLYAFSEAASVKALQRLRRLSAINPDVTFFPVVGLRQFFYLPMIVDGFMFGSVRKLPLVGLVSHAINWIASSAPGVFKLSEAINKKVVMFASHNKLAELCARMDNEGVHALYPDFTPMALWNLDHMILQWFNDSGKLYDFDYLIYYEFDIYTTKPLDTIYEKYTKSYDACFNDYEEAAHNWYFYHFPPGSRWATKRWLKRRMLPTTLYRSNFAGTLISRRCLERLKELGIDFSGAPYCQEEMRLPTVLTALGFRCGKLDFPFVRYRPAWPVKEILANEDAGVFHPVKELVPTETAVQRVLARASQYRG
jgi:hypothetical protein